jgi:hypothetical protein
MSLIYKNPISASQLTGAESVARDVNYGTNFSVLQVGGYMEVYTLNDLSFTVPAGQTGTIEYSGNTIPITYSKRALPFLPDSVTLNSDNISSGRRRLGMLVYVHETEQTYQYTIPNYESLWDAASGSTQESDFGTTVTTSTTGGTAFIDAWLDSSIEGVSGVTRDNARWRVFWGTDWQITGGTYNSGTGTLNLDNNTGGTINVTGFTTGGGSDTYITGGTVTYNSQGTLQLSLNDDSNVDITGFTAISNATLVGDTLTLIKNVGDDIVVTGFTTVESDTYVTGGTYTETTGTLSLLRNDDNNVDITGWSYVKTVTESSNVFTITLNDNSTTSLTVDAVTGLGRNEWALSGTSTGVSAPSVELPFITGGTYSSGNLTLNINDGLETDITITGLDSDDTYLTGATYTPTTLTLGMNDGSEFNVGGFAPEITGGTLSNGTLSLLDNTNGSVDITGFTTSGNLYSADGQLIGDRVVDQNSNSLTFSGGSVSMGTGTASPVCALLELASTNQGLLIPRMTQVQRLAINTPIAGLIVYCTNSDSNGDEGMYMYKSLGWVNVL